MVVKKFILFFLYDQQIHFCPLLLHLYLGCLCFCLGLGSILLCLGLAGIYFYAGKLLIQHLFPLQVLLICDDEAGKSVGTLIHLLRSGLLQHHWMKAAKMLQALSFSELGKGLIL